VLTYRKADADDIDELIRLRIDFLRENSKTVRPEGEYRALEGSLRAYFTDALRTGAFVSWVAQEGDEIVGTSGLSFSVMPPQMSNPTGRIAHISNMYTKPSRRRRGICTELLKRAMAEAKSLGYGRIELNATPKGMAVYKKQGFKEQTAAGLVRYIGGKKENDDHA
jgi:GNAT superfamily N-acetyltransferase